MTSSFILWRDFTKITTRWYLLNFSKRSFCRHCWPSFISHWQFLMSLLVEPKEIQYSVQETVLTLQWSTPFLTFLNLGVHSVIRNFFRCPPILLQNVNFLCKTRASPKCYKCPKKHTGPTIWFHSIKLKLFKFNLLCFDFAKLSFRKKVKINR